MKIYYAGVSTQIKILKEVQPKHVLISYFAVKNKAIATFLRKIQYTPNIFLDSGAYSAMTRGVKISVEKYGKYVESNKKYLNVYANLDVIFNAEKTYENQKKLEELGLNPLPVFHVTESWDWLEKYCKYYDYVGIGGLVPFASDRRKLTTFLNKVFRIAKQYRTKLHGFGCNAPWLLKAFDFYSVDSTSWLICHRNRICVNEKLNRVNKRKFIQTYPGYQTLVDNPTKHGVFILRQFMKFEEKMNMKPTMHYWEAGRLFLTYCSGKKYPVEEGIPKQLYDSPRIRAFIRKCELAGVRYGIVSAKYGLVFDNEVVKTYDVTLKEANIPLLKWIILKKLKPFKEVIFYAPNPIRAKGYIKLLPNNIRIIHSVEQIGGKIWSIKKFLPKLEAEKPSQSPFTSSGKGDDYKVKVTKDTNR